MIDYDIVDEMYCRGFKPTTEGFEISSKDFIAFCNKFGEVISAADKAQFTSYKSGLFDGAQCMQLDTE